MSLALHVRTAGALTTVQDRGRRGLAHLGVPRAGPLDRPAADLANRLVGNGADAALLEVTWGGLELDLEGDDASGAWVAVTGAPVPLEVRSGSMPAARSGDRAEWLPVGARLRLGPPVRGVRSYLAVAGGLDVPTVLGSRSTDTLSWTGPPPVEDGTRLPVGTALGPPAPLDTPRSPLPGPVRVVPGPRADWFPAAALARLCAATWTVTDASNRVGVRLRGPALERIEARRAAELPSEGMVLGAVQLPPDGQPVVFLADHPPTGGYPVLAVVHPEDLWRCGQLRPGERLAFTAA